MRDGIPLESLVRERSRESGAGRTGRAAALPPRRRPSTPRPPWAPFPRPSPLFVGREAELGRCRRLLGQSPLLLTYGLPGIGKTEFIYRLVAELRAMPRWRRAQPVLLRAHAGLRIEDVLVRLDPLLHPAPAVPKLTAAFAAADAAALTALSHRLEQAPQLVFIDDAHHLEPTALAAVLSYLARRISASRLLIAARAELPLLADMPSPTVVRLGPLSAAETAGLAVRLAECQGLSAPDLQTLPERTYGSPRRLYGLVLKDPGIAAEDKEALAQTVRQLTPASRELLLLARVLAGRLPISTWPEPAVHATAQSAELTTLVRCQLIEFGQGTVPDLVWSAIAEEVTPAELQRAHLRAAQLHHQHCACDPVGAEAAAAALSAVEHYLAAGEPQPAWQIFHLWAPVFCGEQLVSAALALLPKLHRQLASLQVEIDLVAVRLLIGEGQLEPAQLLLRQAESVAAPETAERCALLAGQVAQRAGQLSRAAELFRTAAALPGSAAGQFLAAVHQAELAALRGESDLARSLLDTLSADAARKAQWTKGERLQAACARVWMELLLGHPAAAAQAAQAALGDMEKGAPSPGSAPLPPDDPQGRLLVLTALSHSACGEVNLARRALEQVRGFASATGAPSAQAVALCTGFVLLAAGQPAAARAPLQHAYGVFVAQQDLLPAAGAALALGECSLALGELSQAIEQLGEAGRAATRAGCAPLQGLASALRASALLAAGRTESALSLSAAVLGNGSATPRARALARSVRWRVYALAGDTSRAAQELAAAAAEASESEQEVLLLQLELEQAEFAAAHGLPVAAIEHGERAARAFTTRGMQHEAARARLAIALALVTRRAATDLSRGQEFLTEASELANRRGYAPLLLAAALIEAALAHQGGDMDAVREPLERTLAQYPAAAHGLAAQPLRAALAGLDSGDWSGNATLLTRLGLLPGPESSGSVAGPIELRSTSGRRLLTPDAARTERARFDLAIDLDRSELLVCATGQLVSGRPQMCAVLAQLVTAGLAGADSERLFREVWKGTEYHPLRHRNTIHVALTRLRQLLRELFPKREFIETTASGWRLTPESSLCTLRMARA